MAADAPGGIYVVSESGGNGSVRSESPTIQGMMYSQ